ncbi:hypothetical protein [Streptomyces sp. NPDC101115]|uniref:hypothetical protein n=1 Tax=Streptomyces sp. NPDC101115 TaxID=3366106 RepID=UPI0037F6B894
MADALAEAEIVRRGRLRVVANMLVHGRPTQDAAEWLNAAGIEPWEMVPAPLAPARWRPGQKAWRP